MFLFLYETKFELVWNIFFFRNPKNIFRNKFIKILKILLKLLLLEIQAFRNLEFTPIPTLALEIAKFSMLVKYAIKGHKFKSKIQAFT